MVDHLMGGMCAVRELRGQRIARGELRALDDEERERREEGARDPEADAEDAHPQRLGFGGVGGGVGGVHGELRDSVTVGFQRRPFWQSKVSAVNVFAVQEELAGRGAVK